MTHLCKSLIAIEVIDIFQNHFETCINSFNTSLLVSIIVGQINVEVETILRLLVQTNPGVSQVL